MSNTLVSFTYFDVRAIWDFFQTGRPYCLEIPHLAMLSSFGEVLVWMNIWEFFTPHEPPKLLHKNICFHSKSLDKMLPKVLFFFPIPIMARKGTLPVSVLKTPLPGQMITHFWRHEITFATVHVTDDDVRFCDDPGMLIYVKPQIRVLTACELPGVVPVKCATHIFLQLLHRACKIFLNVLLVKR